MSEIQLVTVPKITHRLKELGENVTARLRELNIDSLVATESTLKDLKTLRADLNKELDSFEEQRKNVKNGILAPYNEFNTIYESEISEKYKKAIDTLKDKIGVVETRIKTEKKNAVKAYFDELCTAEKIDFIPFEKLGLDINLSTSEKAYKEKCSEFVNRVLDDLNLIRTEEFQPEIITEYKISLNASQAISTVRTRKENERIEREKIKQIEYLSRVKEVKASGLEYDEFAKVYLYEDEVMFTDTFLHDATKDEYAKKLVECQEKVKQAKASISSTDAPKESQPQMNFSEKPKPSEAIGAPKVTEAAPELVTASFKVTGTMAQLRALGQYMKDNKITYQNIK